MLKPSPCRLLLAIAACGLTGPSFADQVPLDVTVSSEIPGDFFSPLSGAARNLEGLQHDFDVYSWDTFIALNWPVDKKGNADASKKIGASSPYGVVWETWQSVAGIFRADGLEPFPWGSKGHTKFEMEEPLDSGALIDQNGEYVRFEILVNRDMFDYIVSNRLYSIQGQEEFKKTNQHVVFPCGRSKENAEGLPIISNVTHLPQTDRVGSIMVKAAWKVLSKKEVASNRFLIRQPEAGQPVLGLAGFHIVHKSEDVPQWNWSTFEQIDNVPEAGSILGHARYSFFSSEPATILPNMPPSRPWDPRVTEPQERRSRIARMVPITAGGRALNERAHDLLRQANPRSIWQYYQLVSTQWPTRPARTTRDDPHICDVVSLRPADIIGGPAPIFLANTTLESYLQRQVPNTSSSCMDCHANATTQSGIFSDFTFIFTRAQSERKQ
jgi:hypothetical protein